jgi:hypothetical protein
LKIQQYNYALEDAKTTIKLMPKWTKVNDLMNDANVKLCLGFRVISGKVKLNFRLSIMKKQWIRTKWVYFDFPRFFKFCWFFLTRRQHWKLMPMMKLSRQRMPRLQQRSRSKRNVCFIHFLLFL